MKKKLIYAFALLSVVGSTYAQNPFDFSEENLHKVVRVSKGQRTLDLSYKEINTLPSDLSAKLKPVVDAKKYRVQTIDLSHSNISQALKKGTFNDLVYPIKISLNNNNITTVEPGAFQALNSLEIIDLSHNKIKKLPIEAFDTIMGLSALDLSYNQLSVVKVGVFDNLRLLYFLDLSHNNIKKLESAMFASIDATSTGFTAKGPRRASNLNTIV